MEEENIFCYVLESVEGKYQFKSLMEAEYRDRIKSYLQRGEKFHILTKELSYDDYDSFQLYLEELAKANISFGKIAFDYESGIETDRCGINLLSNVDSHYVVLEDLDEIDNIICENQRLRRRVDIVSLSLVEDWVMMSDENFLE